jgi:hypothetical protein
MKTKKEIENWVKRDNLNPMIVDYTMELVDQGFSFEDSTWGMVKVVELMKLSQKNGFETEFTLYDVEDINELSGITADYMTNGLDDIQIQLENKELTWLELWAAADNLYKKIGDTEHLFVESFDVIQNGDKTEVQVFFGS